MLVMLLFVSLGNIVQQWDFKYGILITEFLLIALPTIIFVKLKGVSVKTELRLNRNNIVDAALVVVIFMSGYWVAVFINMIGQIALSLLGELITPQIPFAESGGEYFILLLVIAGSAGVCEEILCRGYLMRAYEGLGMWPGIITSAVLFSLLHLNIQNTLAPLFLGLLLGFVVYKTDSIFAGMLGHFTNNAVSVTWGYVIMNLPIYENLDAEVMQQGLTTASLVSAAVLFGVISLATGVVMIISLKALSERHPGNVRKASESGYAGVMKNIRLSWPLLVTLIIFIIMMVLEVSLIMRGKPMINV
jgi:membrane protease YdiL (CAAX protease family)